MSNFGCLERFAEVLGAPSLRREPQEAALSVAVSHSLDLKEEAWSPACLWRPSSEGEGSSLKK